jgi:hypothetical protein
MRDAARGALKNLSRIEKSAHRPIPIKEQLDAAAKQAAAHNARHADQAMDKPAPAPTPAREAR